MKLKCNCDHKGQDELHGANIRVHNPVGPVKKKQPSEKQMWRCTVCGSVKNENG
jgi:hypothetical protein